MKAFGLILISVIFWSIAWAGNKQHDTDYHKPSSRKAIKQELVMIDQTLATGYFSAEIYLRKCRLLIYRKDWVMAELAVINALKVNNKDPEAWFLYGVIHERLGEKSMALLCYNNVLSLNPYHESALINRGILNCKTGNPDKAMDDWAVAASWGCQDALDLINILHVW